MLEATIHGSRGVLRVKLIYGLARTIVRRRRPQPDPASIAPREPQPQGPATGELSTTTARASPAQQLIWPNSGGVNPVTGEQAIDTPYCKRVLAVLATAGLYEQSGQWLYDIGLPGKSGVSGGIVTVSPGKGGLGTFSPPLDAAEDGVKEQHITGYLSEALGLNLFSSVPAV